MPAFDEQLQKALDERRIVLGGCCVRGNDPDLHCNSCGFKWRRTANLVGAGSLINTNPEEAKFRNILEMAFAFTAMGRVFGAGSGETIRDKLETYLSVLCSSTSESDYDAKHAEFCGWFTRHILTAKKGGKGSLLAGLQLASWGQAAKVLDIMMKVCVYYCHMPDPTTSSRLEPYLHGAVDTPILSELKERFNESSLSRVSSIAGIGRTEYETLQRMIRRDISERFKDRIIPVEYDDIEWRRLNR
jgi:hypothetical protein